MKFSSPYNLMNDCCFKLPSDDDEDEMSTK